MKELYRNIPFCRGCGEAGNALKPVFAMDPMPLAGGYCESRTQAESAEKFPLTWIVCTRCGLTQVLEDVLDSVLYEKYNYSSSTISGMVKHFAEYSNFLQNEYKNVPAVRLLEIGCNDGVLLNQLPISWQLFGVDPSDIARTGSFAGSRYELINAGFSPSVVREHKLEEYFDVITGSNCLAHISDLKKVFEAAYIALRSGGHLWIEVHDFDALLKAGQWDTIYHEHKVEWSESSLIFCLGQLGFSLIKTKRLELHGGLLRICFKKGEKSDALAVPTIADFSLIKKSFERRYDQPSSVLIREANARKSGVAAYGAAGRATVYLNQMRELRFDFIVDESPVRCGKFIPGTALPIVPRSALARHSPELCLITAWSYKDQITVKNSDYRGCWLTAF